ncbi:hypothetical protein D3C84_1068170 [compost metagenome]
MPVPLLAAEAPEEDHSPHAPLQIHCDPYTNDAEIEHDSEQVAEHNPEQPHR